MTERHVYLSTACWHALFDGNQALHTSCRNVCKFCPRPCGCECHAEAGTQTERFSPVDQARDVARDLLAELRLNAAVLDPALERRIRRDPALFWLRGEEAPPGVWQNPTSEET